jgi:thiol-disulfide isomerase/thioredoxin
MRRKSTNVFVSLLELLRVKHTGEFSNRYFNEHPHKYNLFGISKMLSDYGIKNAATRIADKETAIYQIETPFIAHTGSDFGVVEKVDSGQVHYLWRGKAITLPVNEFTPVWSGVILLAETSEKSIEPDYNEHRKKELLYSLQNYLLPTSAGLLFLLAYISHSLFTNLGLTILVLLNLLGIYTGYLLVLKQLYIHSEYADKICSLFKQNDCNNILESKAAKLWGVFGWSEIGLGYFLANTLILLFLPHLISYLAIINLGVLPYSVWSVWYQKFKAKQWCVLCLIVQALFGFTLVVHLIFGFIRLPDWNVIQWMITGCIFAVSILGVNSLIPKLSKERLISHLKQEINSIKADEDVFRAILKKQTRYEVHQSDSKIIFGNPDAKLFITVFSNPYCHPCARMHKRMEKLLEKTNNRICIQYILSSFDVSLEDTNKYLIAAYSETQTPVQVFSDWFEKGKTLQDEFFKKMNLNINMPEVETEFQQHKTWREKTKISATPTVLVNGYQLPDHYKMEDLRYFTELNVDVK